MITITFKKTIKLISVRFFGYYTCHHNLVIIDHPVMDWEQEDE